MVITSLSPCVTADLRVYIVINDALLPFKGWMSADELTDVVHREALGTKAEHEKRWEREDDSMPFVNARRINGKDAVADPRAYTRFTFNTLSSRVRAVMNILRQEDGKSALPPSWIRYHILEHQGACGREDIVLMFEDGYGFHYLVTPVELPGENPGAARLCGVLTETIDEKEAYR